MGRGKNNSSASPNATQASRNLIFEETQTFEETLKEQEMWLADVTELGQSIREFLSDFEAANEIDPSNPYELDHNGSARLGILLGREDDAMVDLDFNREMYELAKEDVLRHSVPAEITPTPLMTEIIERTLLAQAALLPGFLTDRNLELLNDSTQMGAASDSEKAELYSVLSLARDFAAMMAVKAAEMQDMITRRYGDGCGDDSPAIADYWTSTAAEFYFGVGRRDFSIRAFPFEMLVRAKKSGIDAVLLDYSDGGASLVTAKKLEKSCSALLDESADYDLDAFKDPEIAPVMIGYKGMKSDARQVAKDLGSVDLPIAIPVESPHTPGKFTVCHMKGNTSHRYSHEEQLESLRLVIDSIEEDSKIGGDVNMPEVLQALTPDEVRDIFDLRERVNRYKSEFESGDMRNGAISIIGDEHRNLGLLEEPKGVVAKILAAQSAGTELVVVAGYFHSDSSDEKHAGIRDKLKEKFFSALPLPSFTRNYYATN